MLLFAIKKPGRISRSGAKVSLCNALCNSVLGPKLRFVIIRYNSPKFVIIRIIVNREIALLVLHETAKSLFKQSVESTFPVILSVIFLQFCLKLTERRRGRDLYLL